MQPYKFRKNIDIGALDAENDRLLESAFVVRDDYTLLSDTTHPNRIILGRTGSGKSALIRRIEGLNPRTARINPESISLRHLSNSDILQYFYKLNVKLDLFYKVLWKHVFVVELIKLRFQNDLKKSFNLLEWFKNHFPDKKRKRAIDYLEKWEDKFFETTEYRIKDLETSVENRFKEAVGVTARLSDILSLDGASEEERKIHDTIRTEVIHKAQRVINESHVPEIDAIISLMTEELFNDDQRKYFLLIDDLDKDWVSDSIVYDLIKALIETVKDLSQIPNVKIVIALRSNIHQRIFHENTIRGVQREKYNHLYLKLSWSKADLIELINCRLAELMRGHYSNVSPKVLDILPPATDKAPSGIDYMLERTFYRPRDIIDFFNRCIALSDGKTKINRETIRLAEADYSNERLWAVLDEWAENYGAFECMVRVLDGGRHTFSLEEIRSRAEAHFVQVLAEGQDGKLTGGMRKVLDHFRTALDIDAALQEMLVILYEIGVIGIKKGPDTPKTYSYEQFTPLEKSDFGPTTRFYVHPMFWRALRIASLN